MAQGTRKSVETDVQVTESRVDHESRQGRECNCWPKAVSPDDPLTAVGFGHIECGMSTEVTVRVNFGRAMPLFPLHATALMPSQIVPLRIFEPRYRQMVERVFDAAGQVAMATYDERHGAGALKPAVCVGQIMQHAKMPDGNYAIVLQGICRARIVEELPPGLASETEPKRLYRAAMLEPVGIEPADEPRLEPTRRELSRALAEGPLSTLRNADSLVEHLNNQQLPASAIIELVGLTYLTTDELRYELLATGDVYRRAGLIARELRQMQSLLKKAAWQRPGGKDGANPGVSGMKGVSLN